MAWGVFMLTEFEAGAGAEPVQQDTGPGGKQPKRAVAVVRPSHVCSASLTSTCPTHLRERVHPLSQEHTAGPRSPGCSCVTATYKLPPIPWGGRRDLSGQGSSSSSCSRVFETHVTQVMGSTPTGYKVRGGGRGWGGSLLPVPAASPPWGTCAHGY